MTTCDPLPLYDFHIYHSHSHSHSPHFPQAITGPARLPPSPRIRRLEQTTLARCEGSGNMAPHLSTLPRCAGSGRQRPHTSPRIPGVQGSGGGGQRMSPGCAITQPCTSPHLSNLAGIGRQRPACPGRTLTRPQTPPILSQVCKEWEAAANMAPADVRTVIVRTGIVLARDGGALGKMVPLFQLFAGRRGMGGREGLYPLVASEYTVSMWGPSLSPPGWPLDRYMPRAHHHYPTLPQAGHRAPGGSGCRGCTATTS